MIQPSDKMEQESRPTLFDFHGVHMTKYCTDNWENVQNFQAKPNDIFIATYPKAGTTWMSCILDLLLFGRTCPERQESIPIYKRVPFLELCTGFEITGKDFADQLLSTPRLIKTHLPVQFIPKSIWNQNSRIVYVARNAKDSVVSNFHFCRMDSFQVDPGDWSTFLYNFMQGKVVYGSWFDHVNGWWEKKQTHPKILYLFYEDISEGSGREIDRLCSFLGLSPSVEEKQQILTQVQFDKMKKNKMANFSTLPSMDHKVSPFMRKGKVGDWRNQFTVAQNEQFNEVYRQKMKDTTLQFRTML
ncbi:cytosolic sulfotransferase 1-like [Halichoeres trimaculatus]|uniref:cytosolic sulfotransferase 1-like n=1 Tax=Halichoeres trimaculatus TaxID=147232 RepID=UPI003D9EF52D